jgi:hypothetical protein
LKRWQIVALFVAGLMLGGTAVWLLTRSDDSSPRAAATGQTQAPATSGSSAPGVATNAQELLDRIDEASNATYHVRYTTGSASGSHAVLEVWHTPDRVRRDIVAFSPSEGTAHTVEILANTKYVRCVQFAGKSWQCLGAPLASSSSLTDPLQGVAHDVAGKKVSRSDTTIVGHPATCYTVASTIASNKPTQFCLSVENVPLRIDGGDGKPVDATSYDKTVPNSVFTPPAPVVGS